MKFRMLSALAVAVLTVGVATACTPDPSASPAPTPTFATEEEAFAAAEETYRNYVDAINQVQLDDPTTFQPVYAWTTGDANSQDRKIFSGLHAERLTRGGESLVASFNRISVDLSAPATVTAVACLDVSAVTLTDAEGNSAVSSTRPDVQTLEIIVVSDRGSETGMLISSLAGFSGASPCG